ncbi:MAG: type II secretion system minor pseudopilin GspH, partial [Marinobacter sp.]
MIGCRWARISQRGFTLIEILVVLIIVGMLAALTIANMAGGSRQRELQEQVREMYLLMQTASEQAVLNNRELGLVLERRGYRFVAFEEESGEWGSPPEPIFRFRSLPDWLVITAHLGNETPRLASAREDSRRPDVVFFSSGET